MTDDIKCPMCGSRTRLRTSRQDGSKFHVCDLYPHCKGKVAFEDEWEEERPATKTTHDRTRQQRVPKGNIAPGKRRKNPPKSKKPIIIVAAVIVSILLIAGIIAAVMVLGGNESTHDTEFEGTWRTTFYDADMADMGSISITYTFSGNNWECTWASISFNAEMSGTFTLDSTANPKTLDLLITDADEMFGFTEEGRTWYGIYGLSGTNLTLTLGGDPGTARPTSFTDSLVFSKQ